MAGSSGSQKLREWQRRMTWFEEARQPVTAFCHKEGVSVASWYRWRKRLLRWPGPADEVASAGFRPVRVVGSASIVVQLQVPTSDPQALRLVIDTLARVDAKRAGGVSC